MSWNGANGPAGFCPNCGSVSKIIWDSKNDTSTCFGCGWKSTRPTNADHIRSMTDEELAEFLGRVKRPCDYCKLARVAGACTETLCDDAMENWLKQPHEK